MHNLTRNYCGRVFTFLYIILIPSILFSQEKKDFESLRMYILSELSARDIQQAFASLDSLEILAETRRQKIQTEMVRAILYYQQGDKNRALGIAMDVEQDYRKNGNYSDQISAIGFIASNFRELGLFNEAIIYLDKAEKSINKLPDGHLKGQYGALLYHESIAIYNNKKDYKKVKENIQQAYTYVESIEVGKQKNFFLATTINFDAANEYNLGNYNKSKELYRKALETLGTKEDLLYGLIMLGKAKVALKEKQYNSSLDYLQVVDTMSVASQFFLLKSELYKTYMDYYEAVEDSVNYNASHYLYLGTIHQNDGELKHAANQALSQLRSKIAVNESKSSSFIAFGILAIGVLLVIIVLMYRRSKNLTVRYEYVIQRLNEGKILEQEKVSHLSNNQNDNLSVGDAISKETEERILLSVVDLESNGDFYLDPNISLTKLASMLETNTKYLTYVIRKHRGKNFSIYINDLRINYIVLEIRKNPELLKYKISYLAELAGFSNHSKFSSEFKRVVGMAPSIFISKMSA